MKKILLFILIVGLKDVNAQIVHQPLTLTYAKVEIIYAELKEYEKKLDSKYDELFKNKNDKSLFIKELIETNAYFFESGKIYYNWTEAETYLTTIVKEVLKENWNQNITVHIVRDPEDNAFMIEDGTIYINAGLLANTNSEAELASTIGHEFGHYKNLDSYRGFVTREKARKKMDLLAALGVTSFGPLIKVFKQSRQQENEADAISIELLKNSSYNPYGFVSDFEKYRLMEEKNKSSVSYMPYFFHTHPSSEDRIDKARSTLKTFDTTGKKWMAVNEKLFYTIKSKAIDESIILFLQNLDFRPAIELCYRELLLHPNDEFYLFYLTESIRRLMAQSPLTRDQFFITEPYKIYSADVVEKTKPFILSETRKELSLSEQRKLIFFNLRKIIFYNENYSLGKLPASQLINNDTLEFVTNNDAYKFFYKKMTSNNFMSNGFSDFMQDPSGKTKSFTSTIPYLKAYNPIEEEINQFFNFEKKYGNTNFIFQEVNANETRYKGLIQKNGPCCGDTILSFVNSIFSKQDNGTYRLWEFDSIIHTERNKFLLFMNAVNEYSDTKSIKFGDLKAGELNKKISFPFDALSIAPEMIGFLKENKLDKTYLVDININFNDISSYPGSADMMGAAAGMMGDLGKFVTSEVVVYLNIHQIDYRKNTIKQSQLSYTLEKGSEFKKDFRTFLLDAFDKMND
jgi:hypothetical protein